MVTLDEIGLGDAKPVEREARRVSTAGMGCPNCGGPLDLIAPDKAERVTCPNCNSLLDVNQGNLTYLKALNPPPDQPDFVATDRCRGRFPGDVKFKIIGAVVRSVTIDGIQYFWHEYLLYNPMIGFRWLVHSDNHWNFVEPVNPADVEQDNAFGPGSGQIQREYVQDLSGRTGRRRICKRRILLACRTGRDRPGGRLCFAAADALAGDDRKTR